MTHILLNSNSSDVELEKTRGTKKKRARKEYSIRELQNFTKPDIRRYCSNPSVFNTRGLSEILESSVRNVMIEEKFSGLKN